MKLVALSALVALTGCTSPALTANIGIGAAGITVRPAVSTDIGGANVLLSP